MTQIKNLLLVEDDLDDQLFFSDAISEIENAILLGIANNGREALDKLQNSIILPDLIFMDINMPVMNGIQCLEEIVKEPVLKTIPVIILSGSTSEVELVQRLGAKAFIKKPTNGTTLRTKLEQIINLDFIANSARANQTFQDAFTAI